MFTRRDGTWPSTTNFEDAECLTDALQSDGPNNGAGVRNCRRHREGRDDLSLDLAADPESCQRMAQCNAAAETIAHHMSGVLRAVKEKGKKVKQVKHKQVCGDTTHVLVLHSCYFKCSRRVSRDGGVRFPPQPLRLSNSLPVDDCLKALEAGESMPQEVIQPNFTAERPSSPTPAYADVGSSDVVQNVSANDGVESPLPVGSITRSEEELLPDLPDREGLVDLATGQSLAITGHLQPPPAENAGQWVVHNDQRKMSPCCGLSATQGIIPQPWLHGNSSLKMIGQSICAELEVAILCMQKRLGKVTYFIISMGS